MDYPAYAASLKKAAMTQAGVSFADMDLTPGEVNENLNPNPENFDAQQPEEQPQEQQPQQQDHCRILELLQMLSDGFQF